MALEDINKNSLTFKRVGGKAHTQETFAFTEESISSNIQIASDTIFANKINSNPISDAGLTTIYDTDGIVEKIRFEIDIIPNTEIGVNQSQGYRLKLPSGYSGVLSGDYSGGTYLHSALGKLQIVKSLFGELKNDGSTEYDPILYQTNGTTEITKFNEIDWILDTYSGVLFIENPPSDFNNSVNRPAFLDAFLYVGDYLSDFTFTGSTSSSGDAITGATSTGDGISIYSNETNNNLVFKSILGQNGVAVSGDTDNVVIYFTGETGATNTVIGEAEDGDYSDGIYDDFTEDTPIGTVVDRFNTLLKLIAPNSAPSLDNIDGISTNNTQAKLSFGSSNNDLGYYVVTGSTLNNIDINGTYDIGGNNDVSRIGAIYNIINGTLNQDVTGNVGGSGIPYEDNAFSNGDKGSLVILLNNNILDTINLESVTGAIGSTNISVSEVKNVKTNTGNDFIIFKYRTGTYNIPVASMRNGFNYVKIVHSGSTITTTETNYIEWVYDPNVDNISSSSLSYDNINLTGSKTISGVKYHTGGSVRFNAIISNAYKNIYSSSSNAISFGSRTNVGNPTVLDITGSGVINVLGTTSLALPILDINTTNPQNTNITISATMSINSNIILGNTGKVESKISVVHPFSTKSHTSDFNTLNGFLVYNVTQSSDINVENFTGEIDRLQSQEYTGLTFTNVDSGVYVWDSSKSLVGVDPAYNNGLLVFNGNLLYPNAPYLETEYGVTGGNFTIVDNSPASNVNYSGATGEREYIRKFESNNGTTQAELSFAITHTGTQSNFLTDGGNGGTPSSNSIKFEFLIMRSNGEIYGWANPFATSGNPNGIARTSLTHSGGITRVTSTLATTPRVGNGDLVLIRIKAASGWTNRISNISITNI